MNVVCSLQRKEKVDAELLLFFSLSLFCCPSVRLHRESEYACSPRNETTTYGFLLFFFFSSGPIDHFLLAQEGQQGGRIEPEIKSF